MVILSRLKEVCAENSLNRRPKFAGEFRIVVRNYSPGETMVVINVVIVKLRPEERIEVDEARRELHKR